MDSLFKLSVLIKAVDQLSAPVRRMMRSIGDLNRMARAAQGLKAWGRGVAAAGVMVGAVGAGVTAAMAGPLSASANFEQAMSSVAAVAGATDAQMAAMTATARDLGATTSFSATQAADGMRYLGMAGFKANDIIASMPGVLAMARAGAVDLGQASDIASDILAGFGLSAADMTGVADLLTATFTSSNTTLGMLGETMKYVGPVASTAGVSLRDAAAMAGLLGNVGIKASQAGTTLRAVFSRLSSPVGEATASLAALGVETIDGEGNVRDMVAILTDLSAAMEGMGSARRMTYLKDIFGDEAGAGAAELIKQAGLGTLASYIDRLSAVGGTAQTVADIMGDNLAGRVTELKSALEGLFIGFGNTVAPALKGFVEDVTALVRRLTEWTEAHPALSRAIGLTALALGGFLMVSAPVLLALGGLSTLAGHGLIGATRLAGGLGRLVGSVRAVGVAMVAWNASAGRALTALAGRLWRIVTLQGLMNAAALRGGWGNLIRFQALRARLALLSAVGAARAWSVAMIGLGKGAILGLPARIGAVTLALKAQSLAFLAGARSSLFTAAGWRRMATGAIPLVVSGLRGVVLALRAVGIAALANPLGLLVAGVVAAALLITKYWKPIKGFFVGLFEGLREGLKPVMPAITKIGDALGFLIQPILDLMSGFGDLLEPIDDVGGAAEAMGARVGRVIGDIITWIVEIPARIVGVGEAIVTTIADGIENLASKPFDKLKSAVGDMRDLLPFSPAKTGPLKDLNRIRLVETIADTIRPAPLVNALRAATAAAVVAVPMTAGAALDLPRAAGTLTVPRIAALPGPRTGGGAAVTIDYNPTITIEGAGAADDLEARVLDILRRDRAELERLVRRAVETRDRGSFEDLG